MIENKFQEAFYTFCDNFDRWSNLATPLLLLKVEKNDENVPKM